MNAKMCAALVVGLCIGVAATLLVKQPAVMAAEPPPQWEYKAVYLIDNPGFPPDLSDINKNGYEFVSLSATGGRDAGCIAVFRRHRK